MLQVCCQVTLYFEQDPVFAKGNCYCPKRCLKRLPVLIVMTADKPTLEELLLFLTFLPNLSTIKLTWKNGSSFWLFYPSFGPTGSILARLGSGAVAST